jgi:uncharacterized protein (DUF433 family)
VTTERKQSLAGVVSIDPMTMHGTPCFTGTRVPVQTLLDYIEDGDTLDSFLRDFVTVTREQAVATFSALTHGAGAGFQAPSRKGGGYSLS